MVGFSNSTGQIDLADYYKMLERRIARLERGVSGAPSTDVVVIGSLAITGLALATQTITTDGDNYRVMMRYSWTAVPDDPSEYNKEALDGYLTSWSLDGTHWTAELFTTDTFADVGPFTQSQVVTFRVRARTVKGSLGNFSSISNTTTADATAPFQPATPVVSPYLGQLAIDWNGLDVSSNPMPTDFRFCEVHLSTSSPTFTPSTATLVGTILRGGGTWVATGLAYGTVQYARLVAVDTVGNRSVASTAGSGTPVQAADGDIASLGVGKLTAGVISAIITISGRIATSLTGARAEMNSNGFQAFNSSGQQTFDVKASTGAVTITGAFRTAFPSAGVPYVDMTSIADRTTLTFYDASGTNPAFMNTPIDGSGNPMVGINTAAFTYNSVTCKHRLFMANASGIILESFRTSGGNNEGGRLALTGAGATLGIMSNGVINGGYVDLNGGQAKLNVQNSGSVAAELAMFDDQSWWVSGVFSADNVIGGDALVFCGSWSPGSNTDFILSYGTTFSSTPNVIYSFKLSGASQGDDRCSAESATGFTIHCVTACAPKLNYFNFRTT